MNEVAYSIVILFLFVANIITYIKGYRYFSALKKQKGLDYYLRKQQNLQEDLLKLSLLENSLQRKFDSARGDKTELILLSDLEQLALDEWYSPNKTIRFKVINKTNDELTFITEMKDGAVFSNHYHDCEEKCYVYEGCLFSPERGIKTHKDETITYHPYERHAPFAIGETKLTVVFTKK
jgi:hypothetical protein